MSNAEQLLKNAELFLIMAGNILEKEIANSGPALKKKYLENLKIRQQRWRDKQDPKTLTEKSHQQWDRLKSLKGDNPLKFLTIHLGRQVAFKRNDERKKQGKPELLSAFEVIASKIVHYRNELNTFTLGGDPNDPKLPELISKGTSLANAIRPAMAAIAKTIDGIVSELNIIYDSTKA